MKEFVNSISPNFDRLIEAQIFDDHGESIGWHSAAVEKSGLPLSSGTADTRSKARRIALAELCERAIVDIIAQSDLKQDFLYDQYPSTSGFAFGFENQSAKYRSVAEACERWVWSKWIDEGYKIEAVEIDLSSLSRLSKYYLNHFDSAKFYQKKIEVEVDGKLLQLKIGITVGCKGDGVFPGSRVASLDEDVWEHGLLEAYRHLRIAKKQNVNDIDDIIYKRIFYFSQNRETAFYQIDKATNLNWEMPKIILHKDYKVSKQGLYLWRTLFDDFMSWSDGGVVRFVY